MTKAEKIFDATYRECRIHIMNWGIPDRNPNGKMIGYSGLITKEVTSRRTWNAIQKLIDKEWENLKRDRYLEILSAERLEALESALEMTQSSLDNEISKGF